MANQLCFSVSFQKVKFAVLDAVYKLPVKAGEIELKNRAETDNTDALKKWLNENNLLQFDGEVSLSVVSKNSTLVPQNIVEETTHKAIYELCFASTKHRVDFNRFPEMGLVNIYEIPDWLKSFFVVRYPSIIIQHELTHLLRGLFKGPTFKPVIHIALEEDFFTLVIADKNKLIFSNSFDFTVVDDIVYHLTFVLEQKELSKAELKIEWLENADESKLFKTFGEAVGKILPKVKLGYNKMKSFKNQLLCV